MIKLFKKIFVSSVSILGIGFLVWTFVLLNPKLVYSKSIQFDCVTMYYNQELENGTEKIVKDAIEIIKSSELYSDKINIELCLNENSIYPHLHPLGKGTAYAFFNKVVIYNCAPNFKKNYAAFAWKINDYQSRKFNLTYLLAHEFTHNLQYEIDLWLNLKVDFWKLEGHAEYISRKWLRDNRLKQKIEQLVNQNEIKHIGIPVLILQDGTIQNLDYFKYGLVIQYLMEVENLDFNAICKDKRSLNEIFEKMVKWYKN